MRLRSAGITLITGLVSFAAGALWAQNNGPSSLQSRIYSKDDVRSSAGSWGAIHIYTEENTPTYGAHNMLTAQLEFLPGKQLQPPHEHAEEEFQYVIEGSGSWFLNGKEHPLKQGDLMYTQPWDLHGISNTSDAPLRFFVFKWSSKGVDKPIKKH